MCIPCFAFCAWPTCGARFSCFARIPAFVPVSCPLGVACFVYYPGIACIACLACCVYPRGHPGFVRRGGFPCDARLMGVVWSGGVVRRGGVVRHGRRATRRARGRRPGRLGWRRIVLAAIGRLAGCAGWGLRMPARPAGARNGVGRTRGPDLRPRRVSGSLTRFRVNRRSGVPNANGRPPFCRLRATLADEKANLGFLCQKGGAERSEGVPRFASSGPPAGRTAVSEATRPSRGDTPRRPGSGESR